MERDRVPRSLNDLQKKISKLLRICRSLHGNLLFKPSANLFTAEVIHYEWIKIPMEPRNTLRRITLRIVGILDDMNMLEMWTTDCFYACRRIYFTQFCTIGSFRPPNSSHELLVARKCWYIPQDIDNSKIPVSTTSVEHRNSGTVS